MRSDVRWLLVAALLGACNRGPLPLDPLDDTDTSDTGEPVPLPSCETFGQTRSAWVVSDELDSQGRIFMSYTASLGPNSDELFEIRLAEFGCVE